MNKKKICKKCGRNRRIGKFGKKTASPDGKNPYCRECMMKIRTDYKRTPNGRIKQKKSEIKWRKQNPDKISEYNSKYYKRNKEWIKEKIKQRKEDRPKRKINKRRKVYGKIVINPIPVRRK